MGNVTAITGYFDALSPLVTHGDEKTGSTPVLRSLTHWDATEGRHVRLPFVSGNAIRGVLRRLLMHDFVQRIGYAVQSPKMHHALFTGGILESTDESAGQMDMAFRRHIRDTLPPVGLFGSALGNQMIAGVLVVEMGIPVCKETAWQLPPALAADPRAAKGVRTFTDVPFATRRDDLRADRADDEQAQQMLIAFEAFIDGTRFAHGFALRYASPIEAACMGHALSLWGEQPYIGGKAGSGYGKVSLHYDGIPDPAPYTDYCEREAAATRAALDDLDARLATKPKAKQAALIGGGDDEQGE